MSYNTSKSAVLQMGRSMACELGPKRIRVNTLSPGHIYTKYVTAVCLVLDTDRLGTPSMGGSPQTQELVVCASSGRMCGHVIVMSYVWPGCSTNAESPQERGTKGYNPSALRRIFSEVSHASDGN